MFFLYLLANMRLLKADRECEARACEPENKATKRLRSRHLFFLYLLANMRLLKADRECEAHACEPEIESNEAAAKQTYKYKIQEDLRWRIVNIQE